MDARQAAASGGDGHVENAVFDVLMNPERRTLLRSLITDGPVVTVDDLAETLAASLAGADDEHEKAVELNKIALVHTHLPKLAAARLIHWPAASDEVQITSLLDELDVTTPMTGNILDIRVSHSAGDL